MSRRPSDKKSQYIGKIEDAGHKVDRNQVMHAWHVPPNGTSEFPDSQGHARPQHMWLENGDKQSGYQHVAHRHNQDYENRGVPTARQPERIPALMQASATVGRHVGFSSKRYDRPVMAVYMKDEERVMRNAMTVGTNGYVVGMNPMSPGTVQRRPEDPKEVSDRTMADLYYYPPTTPHRRRSFEGKPSQPQPHPPQCHPPQRHPPQLRPFQSNPAALGSSQPPYTPNGRK